MLLAVLVFRCDRQFVLLYVYVAVLVGLSPSSPAWASRLMGYGLLILLFVSFCGWVAQ